MTLVKTNNPSFGIIYGVINKNTKPQTPESISDAVLLDQIRAGDKTACALCIDKYAPGIYRLALRLMKNEVDAEDVMQETFLNAFKAIQSFEGRAELQTWLYRIAHNVAMMRLRHISPTISSVDEILVIGEDGFAVPEQLFDWCCLPEQDFEKDEVRAELELAIQELSPSLQIVFVLREIEGFSVQKTAETLHVSPDVIKTRLHRARLQLRERLSAYFIEHTQ